MHMRNCYFHRKIFLHIGSLVALVAALKTHMHTHTHVHTFTDTQTHAHMHTHHTHSHTRTQMKASKQKNARTEVAKQQEATKGKTKTKEIPQKRISHYGINPWKNPGKEVKIPKHVTRWSSVYIYIYI